MVYRKRIKKKTKQKNRRHKFFNLKEFIYKAYKTFGVKTTRTKNIANHIGLSFVYKTGSIVANFMLVPIAINYLGSENYGVWLTLSSVISWFSFLDIGLGNGLRNKLTEARALGKKTLEKAYVSTAYFTIGFVSLLMIVVFLFINRFINWAALFNTKPDLQNDLKLLLPIIFAFFALQLIIKLITVIYIADRNYSVQNKIQFITQVVLLLVIWLMTKTCKSSLLYFGIAFSSLPVIVLLFLNLFAFNKKYKDIKPAIGFWGKQYLKDIMGLGINFFVIQVAVLVLFSTDNIIISKIFSPAEVVPYNIAFKYFSIVTMVYTIIISPYWSAFTEAYARKDFNWIRSSIKNIQKIWFFVPVGLLLMLLISDWFYNMWVGDKVFVQLSLSISMALFVLLTTFNMIYVNFINGVGKIKLQLITSLISMTINIPLSIIFAKYLQWGVKGVILATCFSLGYSVVLRPIQYFKIINNKAKGVWNK